MNLDIIIGKKAINCFLNSNYNDVSGKSIIQNQDKEAVLIVGKGLYDKVHI